MTKKTNERLVRIDWKINERKMDNCNNKSKKIEWEVRSFRIKGVKNQSVHK